MEDFLNTIYSYEYFGFYLIISIVILVVLFLVILFFGKKDKKNREIEATKKLEQINADAFKEENMFENLEINENKLEDTIIVPNIEGTSTMTKTEETEELKPPVENTVDSEEHEIMEPILEKIEEKPLIFEQNDISKEEKTFENLENIENEREDSVVVPSIEEIPTVSNVLERENVSEEINVPEFNFEEIVKETKNNAPQSTGKSIFSSVYVKPEEEIELPKVEVPVEKALEDLEVELPSLKKEEKENIEEIEVPVLNDYNLDELSGETYTINK